MSFNFNNNDGFDDHEDKHKRYRRWIMLAIFIWIVLGIAAYVTAFNCTNDFYTGSAAEKIAMFMLAGLLGPFWFIIYYFKKRSGYCQAKK
jgi:hypothetical protein